MTISSAPERTPEEPLRLAVVGAGARAQLALEAERAGLVRVVAIAEPDNAAMRRAQELFEHRACFVRSHRELAGLEPAVEAALIVSPDDTHAEIAIDLLHAGIAVYLEKPLATLLSEADAVLQAAHESGTPLYVGHNMRHMSVVRLMREIIERGEIGEVKAIWCRHFVGNGGDYYFKDWHADRKRSMGLLLQKGAHDIDIIHWLAGGTSKRVVAMGDLSVYGDIQSKRDNSDRRMPDWFSLTTWPPATQTDLNPVVDVEDISMMMMQLDNGVLASYEQCHFTPDYWRNYTIIGTAGRIENFGDSEGGMVRVWNTRTTYSPEGDASYPITGDADGHSDADLLSIAEFVGLVRDGSHTETSPIAARDAVAAAFSATESLRDGSTPRAVPPLAADLKSYFDDDQKHPGSHAVVHPLPKAAASATPSTNPL